MENPVTTTDVWNAIEKEMFAVIGMVTAEGESRTVGIVYFLQDRKFYIGTGLKTWKARHISQNESVSMTIPVPKRIPIAPWLKVPMATITFSGRAKIISAEEVSPELLKSVFRHKAEDEEFMRDTCLIELVPEGEFITYGIGIPLPKMRHPHLARGRAPV